MSLLSIEVLEVFVEAQSRVEQRWCDGNSFVIPQAGKSGLSRPQNRTDEERKAARASVERERRRRQIAKDPTFRAREQAKSRERLRNWRAAQRLKRTKGIQ